MRELERISLLELGSPDCPVVQADATSIPICTKHLVAKTAGAALTSGSWSDSMLSAGNFFSLNQVCAERKGGLRFFLRMPRCSVRTATHVLRRTQTWPSIWRSSRSITSTSHERVGPHRRTADCELNVSLAEV